MQEITNYNIQTPIEWNGQVVITTAQLAEVYGTSPDNVKRNFNRNKDKFTSGKHYYLLEGEELQQFKNQGIESPVVGKTASQLYLWTRRGASRHCKILGTDRAWEQFDYLEDNYFEQKQPRLPMTIPEQIQLLAQGHVSLEAKIDSVKADLEQFKNDMPILGIEETKISRAVRKKGVECLGGKQAPAYKDRSLRSRLYIDLHRQLRREFDVPSYKAIRRNQVDAAIGIIRSYTPPMVLKETIETVNAQEVMEIYHD